MAKPSQGASILVHITVKTQYSNVLEVELFDTQTQKFDLALKKISGTRTSVHRNINQFDENLMLHFRDILKKRQRQITLDRFLLKKESSESASVSEKQPSTSGFTGITPGDELPHVFMDGDSSPDE